MNAIVSAGAVTPSNPTIDTGQPVTWTAHPAGGTAPYTYQWYLSTSNAGSCSSGTSIGGATSSSYTTFPSASIYYCYVVSDSASPPETAGSGWVLVTVNSALVAGAVTPASPTIDSGQSVVLTAHATGGTATYSYQWYSSATGSGSCSLATSIDGATLSTYLAPPTASTYYCYTVTDSATTPSVAGSGWDLVTVGGGSLLTPILSPSSAQALDAGQSVTFQATWSGGTTPFTATLYVSPTSSCGTGSTLVQTFSSLLTGEASFASVTPSPGSAYYCVAVTDSSSPTPSTTTSLATGVVTNTAPSISVQPSSAIIDSGQTVTLSSTVTGGTGPFAWQWYDSSGPIPGASGTGLTATHQFSTADTGIYVVFTDTGTTLTPHPPTTSAPTVSVAVNPALSISVQPSSATIDGGQTVTLTSTVTGGTGPIAWQWYDGSGPIPGASGTGLTATHQFSAADTGIYVTFTDTGTTLTPHPTVTSAPTVSVTMNPVLSAGALTPTGATIDNGQPVTLTAHPAGGTTPYSYQWYLSSSGSGSCSSGTSISGASSPTYTAFPTSSVYYCYTATDSATSPVTAGSGWVLVTVNSALVAGAVTPASPTIDSGQSVVLAAHATGGTPTYHYQWYSSLAGSGSCSSGTSIGGATLSTYLASPIASTYYCYTVTDSATTPSSVGSGWDLVTVNSALTIPTLAPSAPQTIDAGQSVTFQATWSGGATPYTATLYVSPTSSCGKGSTLVQTLSSLPTGGAVFAPVTLSQGTAYYCVAVTDSSSPTPSTTTSLATGVVTNSALVVGSVTPAAPTINMGHSITLTANPSGGTTPYGYQWYASSSSSGACSSGIEIVGATASTYSASPTISTYYCYTLTDGATAPQTLVSGWDGVTVAPVYPVTFSETGLPSGTLWSVTLNGSMQSSTTSTLSFSESNGSYRYVIGDVSGWHQTTQPYTGSVAVRGSPVVESPLAFSQISYTVTFTQSGLPLGVTWWVNLTNGQSYPGTGSTIQFSEPNGSYVYSAQAAGPKYGAPGGTFKITGNPLSLAVTFSSVRYSATFTESGLPLGTMWWVNITGGPSGSSTSSVITLSLVNGTYAFSAASTRPAYLAPGGTFTVNGAAVSESVTFVLTYLVTFTESGLPAGTAWWVNLTNGVSLFSTGSLVSISELNGSYAYSVATADKTYRATGGPFVVNGAPLSLPVAFARVTYTVSFTEQLLPIGTMWWVNLTNGQSFPGTGTSITFAEPNGSYAFLVRAPGYVAYPATGNFTIVAGPVSQTITFILATYSVWFTESGLPNGTLWSVTLGGATQSSTTPIISFQEPNGSYTYRLASSLPEYGAPGGSFVVTGSPVFVYVTFTKLTYTVTFSETGLPSGTNWSVTLNGVTSSSTRASISFVEVNGTFTWSVGAQVGYHATPASGTLTVAGGPVAESITFALVTYTVSFSETGLPAGTSWSVTLNGVSQSSVTGAIAFIEPNGTFAYSIADISGWHQSTLPYGGAVLVIGGAVTEPTLVFIGVTYALTFSETGLPSGMSWTVTLNGVNQSSATATIAFIEPNGTYAFIISADGYLPTPASGTEPVVGGAALLAVTFALGFTVTIYQPGGVSNGTQWSVTLVRIGSNGSAGTLLSLANFPPAAGYSITKNTTAGLITFIVPAGAYAYTVSVTAYPGYSAGGSVSPSPSNPNPVVFPPAVTGGGVAVPWWSQWWGALGMLAAVLAAILLLALFVVLPSRRRRPPAVEMVPTGALFMEHHVSGGATAAQSMMFEGEPPQPAMFVHYVPVGSQTLPPKAAERDETPAVLAVYSMPYGEKVGWAPRPGAEKEPSPPLVREGGAAYPPPKEGAAAATGHVEPATPFAAKRDLPQLRIPRTSSTEEPSVGFEAWVPPPAEKPPQPPGKKKLHQ